MLLSTILVISFGFSSVSSFGFAIPFSRPGTFLKAVNKLDGTTIEGDLSPTSNNVFVKAKETTSVTKGGFIIPDSATERPNEAIFPESVANVLRFPAADLTGLVGPSMVPQWKEHFAFEKSKVNADNVSEGAQNWNEEHLLVKKLPELFKQRYGPIPKAVYVRESYRALYKLATDTMLNPTLDFGVTLFTGVPGIGKSLFLVYFISQFLIDERFPDKRFALEFSRGTYACFAPTAVDGEFICSNQDGSRLPSKQFLLLCDIAEAVEPVSRAKWTFIFSSPAPERYKEILKNSPSWEYILPTWSEFELLCVNPQTDNWYNNFVRFGGVPRYVFPESGRNPHMLINNVLEEKGGSLAESFYKYGFGMGDWMQSYMLVHINPPLLASGDFDYQGKKHYTFASDAIFKWLAEKHSKSMLAGATGMFNAGAASESYGAVSAGKLFEKVVLWLKPLDGMNISAVALSANVADAEFKVPTVRKMLPQDWKRTAQLVPDILYVPLISNLESGDSFYLVQLPEGGYLLVVLQITVGKSHPVKSNGLNDILFGFIAHVREKVVKKALIFVTPAHGELHDEQEFLTKKEKRINMDRMPLAVKDFQQYVYRHTI